MNKHIDLFIFRHGETDWNVAERLQGHTDIPLNINGELQALQMINKFKELGIQTVLSSDLSRAHKTAQIAFQNTQLPISTHSELRETLFGDPEGSFRSEIIQKFGEEAWNRWCSNHEDDLDFSYPNGESKRAVLKRVKDFLEDYIQNTSFTKIAVSTHGGVVRRMVHFSEGSPTQPIYVPNCSLYHLKYSNAQWQFLREI